MSQFSDRLRLVLDESGTNIYQLSKNAKLDRTTIQRVLKGQRLPSISFIEKLCDFLRVSPLQRSELFELYTICKVGEKVYAGRKYIKDMIEHMATIHIKSDNVIIGQRTVTVDDNNENGIKTFSGQHSVHNLIRDVLEDEVFNEISPHIYLTVPFENTFLFDLLYQLYLNSNSSGTTTGNNKKLLIKHIIQLSKNPMALQNSNNNLNVLSNILPYAFCEWGGYEPYYYYGNTEASKDINFVLPHYILTSKRLIQLSADFNTAVLCDNPEILNIYRAGFEKCLLQTSVLINQLGSCEEMLAAYLTANREAGQVTHVIEPQPCLAKYFTDQLIEDKLRKDLENRELIKPLVCQFYDNHKQYDIVPMSFFSIEGIEYFAKTGIIADLPPQYALPFSVSERKMLLLELRNDIADDTYFVRVINSSMFVISPLASVQLYSTNVLMIVAINSDGMISSSFIKEKSICEAFLDFFESLPQSNLLYSKKETIRIIDEVIGGIE